jgi:hypothetical protein
MSVRHLDIHLPRPPPDLKMGEQFKLYASNAIAMA